MRMKWVYVWIVSVVSFCLLTNEWAIALSYEKAAKNLYDLNLYKGRSATEYRPDLDSALTRQDAAIMLLRIMGQEAIALQMQFEEAKKIVSERFVDALDIGDYAMKQVAYATKNGVIQGFPGDRFAPKDHVTGKQFLVLCLRQMGYVEEVEKAGFQKVGDLFQTISATQATVMKSFDVDVAINRDVLIGISDTALKMQLKDGSGTLMEKLVREETVDREKAIKAGFTVEEDLRVIEIF